MKKIAMINQRYGLEVNGGSEYYTRLIAEHLKDMYEIEILTTKAVDYVTWDNFYPNEEEDIHGIRVRRFPTGQPRNMERFGAVNGKILSDKKHSEQDEFRWLKEQGPFCPGLVEYIRDHAQEYDLFIFVTYLYYTTCMGIRQVPDKAVLIPTAHDEPYIYFKMYRDVFTKCRAIVYLTDEEKKFVEHLFHNEAVPSTVTAVGIDMPQGITGGQGTMKQKYGEYIIYVGRIDESKGCGWLFHYFTEYKKRHRNGLKLVLMGKMAMNVPKHPDIVNLGFVSEEEKFMGITDAKVLILPSHFESLSISVLEALQVKTPVIVNGQCEVLKGHCVKSNAGLYYNDYWEFDGCVTYLMEHENERKGMGENGEAYVNQYFRWEIVRKKLKELFDSCMC